MLFIIITIAIIHLLKFPLCIFFRLECQNYKVLNTKGRKSSFKSNSAFCDDGKYGWYRFKGRAGTKMAGTCVPAGRCNTKAQGWLEGAHPGVRDGQITRKVCFNYDSNCCHWSVDIQVRNCGDFFVYLLSGTPDCELRYCGEDWTALKITLLLVYSGCVRAVSAYSTGFPKAQRGTRESWIPAKSAGGGWQLTQYPPKSDRERLGTRQVYN